MGFDCCCPHLQFPSSHFRASGPLSSMASLSTELLPPSLFYFSPSSKQRLCPDRQVMWMFSSCAKRALLEKSCQNVENTRSISGLPRCFLPLACVEVSLETVDRQLLCWPVSSPFYYLSVFKCFVTTVALWERTNFQTSQWKEPILVSVLQRNQIDVVRVNMGRWLRWLWRLAS